jgi:hypothetical protein
MAFCIYAAGLICTADNKEKVKNNICEIKFDMALFKNYSRLAWIRVASHQVLKCKGLKYFSLKVNVL